MNAVISFSVELNHVMQQYKHISTFYLVQELQNKTKLSFCRIEYQLPNLIVGAITKESLYNAFKNGITAEQASFLLVHPGSCYS